MNPTQQSQTIPPAPVQITPPSVEGAETNIFEGVTGLTPRQMYLLKHNLEQNKEVINEHDLIPEEYKYVFTKNYIILSTVLIVVSFLVFGIIIAIEVSGYATKRDRVLGVDTIQAQVPANYSPES